MLFVSVKEFVEKNNYSARITGDKRRRNEDKKFIIYYEDIGNQDVENLFNNLEWKFDAIDRNEEDESIDESIIFTKYGGKAGGFIMQRMICQQGGVAKKVSSQQKSRETDILQKHMDADIIRRRYVKTGGILKHCMININIGVMICCGSIRRGEV